MNCNLFDEVTDFEVCGFIKNTEYYFLELTNKTTCVHCFILH